MSGLGPLETILWHWECSQRALEVESGNVSVLKIKNILLTNPEKKKKPLNHEL